MAPEIISVFFLFVGMIKIKGLLKHDPNCLFNMQAMTIIMLPINFSSAIVSGAALSNPPLRNGANGPTATKLNDGQKICCNPVAKRVTPVKSLKSPCGMF